MFNSMTTQRNSFTVEVYEKLYCMKSCARNPIAGNSYLRHQAETGKTIVDKNGEFLIVMQIMEITYWQLNCSSHAAALSNYVIALVPNSGVTSRLPAVSAMRPCRSQMHPDHIDTADRPDQVIASKHSTL